MSERCTECGGARPGTGQDPVCGCGPEGRHRERVRPYLGPRPTEGPPGQDGQGPAGASPQPYEGPPGHAQEPGPGDGDGSPGTAPHGGTPTPVVGALPLPGQAHDATAPLPKVSDLDLFPPDRRGRAADGQHGTDAPDITPPPSATRPKRTAARTARRRRAAILGVSAGAVVVVALAGAVATDSLPDEKPDERALPRPSATAPHSVAPGPATPSGTPSSTPPSPAAPATTASSAPPSASSGGGKQATSPTPAPGPDGPAAPEPSATRPSTEPPATTAPQPPPQEEPVLRRGDSGPQVRELQQRLQQLHLYRGEANGDFDRRLEDALSMYQWARGLRDSLGVYDEPTRAQLESETTRP